MRLYQLLKDDKVKKSASLFTTMVLSMLAGIYVSVINTESLGVNGYGDFRYILNIYQFIITFLTFGIYYASGRLMAQERAKTDQKTFFGNMLLITLFQGIIFTIVIFVFGIFEPIILGKGLSNTILFTIPFVFITPFQLCFEQILQGNNRIYSLSVLRIGPKIVYIIIVTLLYSIISIDTKNALSIHLISYIFVILFIVFLQKPNFSHIRRQIKSIIQETKSYGFHIYLGAITGVASHYLGPLFLGEVSENDNVAVGHFMLALTATMPLQMLPVSIGTVFFRDFVKADKIPGRVIIYTIGIALFLLIGFNLSITPVVNFLYPDDFSQVSLYCIILSFGLTTHGLGDFFNRFLSAKGKGKILRNTNFTLGAINVIFYYFLIQEYEIYGAIAARILCSFVYLSILFWAYQRVIRQIKMNDLT